MLVGGEKKLVSLTVQGKESGGTQSSSSNQSIKEQPISQAGKNRHYKSLSALPEETPLLSGNKIIARRTCAAA